MDKMEQCTPSLLLNVEVADVEDVQILKIKELRIDPVQASHIEDIQIVKSEELQIDRDQTSQDKSLLPSNDSVVIENVVVDDESDDNNHGNNSMSESAKSCNVFITYSYPFSDNYHVGILEGKLVFVKIKSSKHDFTLEKEYESGMILNQIHHPHLLKTLSIVTVDSTSFPDVKTLLFPRQALITEYICTPVLSDIIHKLSLVSLVDIFIQMTWIVYDVNYKTGLYHRDLHTGNIIIERLKTPIYLGDTGIQTNYYCVVYDFGRAIFHERGQLKSVVSDLKRLTRTLFQKRYYKQGEYLRYLLDYWLLQSMSDSQSKRGGGINSSESEREGEGENVGINVSEDSQESSTVDCTIHDFMKRVLSSLLVTYEPTVSVAFSE
jgi:hypothetical protein